MSWMEYIPTSDDKKERRGGKIRSKTLMDTSQNGFSLAGRKQIMNERNSEYGCKKTASEFWNPNMAIIMQYMLMRTLKFIKGTTEEINHYIDRNYPNILFPGTFTKSSQILQDCMAFCNHVLSFLFIPGYKKYL